jgi:hypothetical protein
MVQPRPITRIEGVEVSERGGGVVVGWHDSEGAAGHR